MAPSKILQISENSELFKKKQDVLPTNCVVGQHAEQFTNDIVRKSDMMRKTFDVVPIFDLKALS